MNHTFTIWMTVVLTSFVVLPAHAEPQRIEIKTADQKASELAARQQIKSLDLDDIEDPAARRAIQQLYVYLGLESGLDTQERIR